MKPVHILSILFYCCFLLPQQFVSGQIPGMKVYTQLDGYPGTVGYVINQDNRGFLWIGTDKGAVCFDGKSFRVYDDRHGLADKEIIAAVPTGNDNVMLMPILNNFSYYKNGRIITKSSELRKIKHRDINRLFFDKHTNKLWLSDGIRVNDSLNYFYNDSVKTIKLPFKSFFTISTIINDKAYISVQDDQSKTVVFMRYHIYREVYDTLHVGPVNLKSTLYTISENEKYFVIHDYDEIDVFELSSDGKLKKIAGLKSKQPVSNTYIDKNNHLYSTCQNGGLEYWGAINKIHENKKPYYFFDGIIINHVWIDHHNNKWFTAKHNGLLFVSEKHWENALFIQQKVLPSYTPAAISGDSTGRIYIVYNQPFLSVTDTGTQIMPLPSGKTGNNLENINGGMFVSGPYLLSGLRNMPGNTWKFYNTFINHISIKNISDYRNDSILLATHAGAFVVRSNVNEQYVLANKRFFSTRSTSALLLPDDKILIGTPNGLFITDFRAGGEKKIDDPLLRDANVTDMELGTDGNILIGTSVQGIFLYKYSNGKLTFRTTVKSAGTSYVNRIYKQNDTTYWASTDRGACRIDFTGDMTEKSGRVYTFFDGLPSSNVSAVFVKNDTAYVATSEGIGVLPLNHMPEISSSFPFWLTRALLDDTALHFPGNEIHLNYNRNNIRLELSAILYESLGSLSFLYRINGLSDKWLETNNPEISLSGLAPGNYKLEVFAVNFNGIKSQQPLLVSIIVHPAFWQTTWFKWMSAVIAVVLLLFIIWRLISREKIKQFNKFQTQRRLAELELEAIKAQINPHFVYNCLNSIQYFNYKNDYASVRQYFSRFAKLIRQTMRFSRETFITLDEETAYLTNYLELEKIRFKEKLDYYIQIDDKLPGSLLIPSMMVQPYVENALKHGVSELDKCGEVRVIFEPDANNWLKILVEDNGPGFAPADKPGDGVHLGHRIAGSRAQAYNQLFGVNIRFLIKPKVTSTGVISGTVVELLIPPIKYENTRV